LPIAVIELLGQTAEDSLTLSYNIHNGRARYLFSGTYTYSVDSRSDRPSAGNDVQCQHSRNVCWSLAESSGVRMERRVRPATSCLDGISPTMMNCSSTASCSSWTPRVRFGTGIPRRRHRHRHRHGHPREDSRRHVRDTRDFLTLFPWQAERRADILATILARMSARMSVLVSASWNASFWDSHS